MARTMGGEHYHDACLLEIVDPRDKTAPYDPARDGEAECYHCGEPITEDDR